MEYVVINNGWTRHTEDFIGKGKFHYLQRKVNAWNCVKLYYGEKPEDSPFLWGYMEKYVRLMAGIFHGFRIDNCHSTPVHVLEHLMKCARSANPGLFVYAELFAANKAEEMAYVKRAGLNALMRELAWTSDAAGLSNTVDWTGLVKSQSPAAENQVLPLRSSRPRALLYDITHDNDAPMQKWNSQAILPISCVAGMSQVAVGSTLGVDYFVPEKLSVVFDRRLYPFEEEVADLEKEAAVVESAKPADDKSTAEIVYKPMENERPKKVVILGSFNDWNKESHPMAEIASGEWKISMQLPAGHYQYKFFVDSRDWRLGSGEVIKDSHGNVNNLLIVERPGATKARVFADMTPVRRIMNCLHAKLGAMKTELVLKHFVRFLR